jgi:dihydropteroate synthase
LAAERGAKIVRVHDVRETASALKILQAVRANAAPESGKIKP